ncbi:MAG: DUF167 domain-containing protein [Planctomycetota bacterium]|jgi:uncharacterized protein (TIGR00251 family)
MTRLKVKEFEGGVIFTVKVVPGSSRTAVEGILGGRLKVKVSTPAEKGKANQSLVELLAGRLSVKKKDISIISGQTNPVKQVTVSGLSPEKLLEKLELE